MIITVDQSLVRILPDFTVIALVMDVSIQNSDEIKGLVTKYEKKIAEEYSLEEVLNIPLIKEGRDGYKKLGKDPSRYRLAVESLYRRIVKGNSLYLINNVVDTGNILSLATMRSVAVLDYHQIQGSVLIRLGRSDDEYYGIGRGLLNVSNIPIYEDEIGPFGSTTSDTLRTSITAHTQTILVFIICFSHSFLDEHKQLAKELFAKYAHGQNIRELDVKIASVEE
ncbi:MAG: B3/4 domain-containing protein [Bacilli bacterium]